MQECHLAGFAVVDDDVCASHDFGGGVDLGGGETVGQGAVDEEEVGLAAAGFERFRLAFEDPGVVAQGGEVQQEAEEGDCLAGGAAWGE